jgi:radical SAM protein with 4Fe4S-binding SPASM domain
VLQLLRMNGGNSSGHGIGCVSWDGSVHADQFWHQHCFGNVRERPFGEIWSDLGNPMMAQLKEKKRHVKGRCAACEYLALCGGNFRARAEAVTGDPWAADPACYLTDDEIRLNKPMSAAGKRFFEESSGTKTLPNTPSTLRNPA